MLFVAIWKYFITGELFLFLYVIIFLVFSIYGFSQYNLEELILLEIRKLENIRCLFINTDKYQRILLLQSYYDQLIYLESV